MEDAPNEELQGGIILGYKLQYNPLSSSSSINYLFDYSKFLIRNKMYDGQIVNWQIENSALLKTMGLNFSFIKQKMDERNKNYYKYDTLLSQLTYRLEKHGQLAPIKEISKKLTEKDLMPDPELKKSINDINYYNQNDSFIDDEEAYTGEEHDGFFKLNLAYGNYSEEDVIKNYNRNKSRLKKKKLQRNQAKIIQEEQEKDKCNNDNDNNTDLPLLSTNIPLTSSNNDIEIKIKAKKRKFGEGIKLLSSSLSQQQQKQSHQISINLSDSLNQSKQSQEISYDSISEEDNLKLKFNALMKEYCELGNGIPLIEREKELFVKKIIPAIKTLESNWINNPLSYTIFLKTFSSLLSISQDHYKILFEYERFRLKIEGIYSNYAKMINQFAIFLRDNSIKDIRNIMTVQEENSDVKEKMEVIAARVFNYVKIYNDYILTIPFDNEDKEKYYKVLEMYVIKAQEKNEEYVSKLGIKIKELFEKMKIEYCMQNIVEYFKGLYKVGDDKEKNKDGRKYTVEDFFKVKNAKINEGGLSSKKKKSVMKGSAFVQMPVIYLSSQGNEDHDNNSQASIQVVSPLPIPMSKAQLESFQDYPSNNSHHHLLADNNISSDKRINLLFQDNIANYHKQLIPLLSSNYYTCPYNEDHFNSF